MSDLARACELPVPSAHRILAALERLGYVTRDPVSRSYRLGPAAARLGGRSWGVGALRPLALPLLRRVTATTGGSAAVTVPSDDAMHAIVAALVRAPQGGGRIDSASDLHGDALGLVLLAQRDELQVEQYLDRSAVPHALVRRQISLVRRRGWSLHPAPAAGVGCSLAVPVLDQTATFHCSIGVYAWGQSLDRAALTKALAVLRSAATALGSRLRADVGPSRSDSLGATG